MTTAIAMVRAGLGVTVQPAATAQETQQTSNLLAREIHHERFRRQICLIQATGRSASPAAKEFMELVQAVCKARKLAGSASRPSPVTEAPAGKQQPSDTHH
jgi:DNA-binding transcriptional LysR family regulator